MRSRLIKNHNKFIVILVALLLILALIPGRVRGDDEAVVPDSPALSPAPITPSQEVKTPQIGASGGGVVAKHVKGRTKRIDVPKAEVDRIVGLIINTFPDAPVMIAVAKGESGFDCGVENPSPKSTASGCFQITLTTWRDTKCVGDILKAEDNIACARMIYDKSKLVPWNESKYSWAPYVGATLQHVLSALKI